MSVEMTPITGSDPLNGCYFATVEVARELAASLPGLATLLAKSDDDMGILLFMASLDIDAAMPYQGVRYDVSGGQVREFPRYQRVGVRGQGSGISTDSCLLTPSPSGVWDWDSDTDAAVVPKQVKIACLYQANALCDAQFGKRLEAIRSGLASQSVGSLSESYLKPADVPGGLSGGGLCDRALRLMSRYRLRSAPFL
jgi:hypothetical protein